MLEVLSVRAISRPCPLARDGCHIWSRGTERVEDERSHELPGLLGLTEVKCSADAWQAFSLGLSRLGETFHTARPLSVKAGTGHTVVVLADEAPCRSCGTSR